MSLALSFSPVEESEAPEDHLLFLKRALKNCYVARTFDSCTALHGIPIILLTLQGGPTEYFTPEIEVCIGCFRDLFLFLV